MDRGHLARMKKSSTVSIMDEVNPIHSGSLTITQKLDGKT